MSFMSFNGFQPMGGLGRLPRMNDPCAATGDPRAAINTQQEDEIKSRLDAARGSVENAIAELDTLSAQAQNVSSSESDLIQMEIVQAQNELERALYRIGDQEDNIKEREDQWVRTPPPFFGPPNRCFYAGDIYEKALPSVKATEDLARTALMGSQVRSLRQAVGNMIARAAQEEEARAAEAARIAELESEARHREEMRLAAEAADREERERLAAKQEEARAASLAKQLEMQKVQAGLEKQRLEAQIAAEEEERAFQRQQWERQWDASRPPAATPPDVGPSQPPPWLAELLARLALQQGPAATPMATGLPVQQPEPVFAFDPFGRPVDAYGKLIPQFPPTIAPAAPQPPAPSYYAPWTQTLTQQPTIAPPPGLPGSPLQLTTFEPPSGNVELFGLAGLGQTADDYMEQAQVYHDRADDLERQAATSPSQASTLRAMAVAERATAQNLEAKAYSMIEAEAQADRASALGAEAAAKKAAEEALKARRAADAGTGTKVDAAIAKQRADDAALVADKARAEAAGSAGSGIFDWITQSLLPSAERAYSTYVTGSAPKPAPKKPSPWIWLVPIGIGGAALWAFTRRKKR